ncbi:MAG: hypothetical protein KAY24_00300 [Candidatus Eisenbacteria sp.]|nr:hypothetical protein [Candidatus Eisenbacteria bacterium]
MKAHKREAPFAPSKCRECENRATCDWIADELAPMNDAEKHAEIRGYLFEAQAIVACREHVDTCLEREAEEDAGFSDEELTEDDAWQGMDRFLAERAEEDAKNLPDQVRVAYAELGRLAEVKIEIENDPFNPDRDETADSFLAQQQAAYAELDRLAAIERELADRFPTKAEAREIVEQDEMDREPYSDAYWAEQELEADAPTPEEEREVIDDEIAEMVKGAVNDALAGFDPWNRLVRDIKDALSPYTEKPLPQLKEKDRGLAATDTERRMKRQRTPEGQRCPEGCECVDCGECDMDRLAWNSRFEQVTCASCGITYTP